MRVSTVPNPTEALPRARLADFTTDHRVLLLIAMAFVVGTGGAAAAWVLLKLIALVGNLVWHGTLATTAPDMTTVPRGAWMFSANFVLRPCPRMTPAPIACARSDCRERM